MILFTDNEEIRIKLFLSRGSAGQVEGVVRDVHVGDGESADSTGGTRREVGGSSVPFSGLVHGA